MSSCARILRPSRISLANVIGVNGDIFSYSIVVLLYIVNLNGENRLTIKGQRDALPLYRTEHLKNVIIKDGSKIVFCKEDKDREMKNLIVINGTMGVGKTTVSQELKRQLPGCAFLDGDWCWDMDPFVVNTETKEMVQDNIVYLLNRFISCSIYENIVFCWVMHQQEILQGLLDRLHTASCNVYCFSLLCSRETLESRMRQDITAGRRTSDVLERSLSRLDNYRFMDTISIDTTDRTVVQAVEQICSFLQSPDRRHRNPPDEE